MTTFDTWVSMRPGIPLWMVVTEMVAAGHIDHDWKGWTLRGKRALRRAARKGTILFQGNHLYHLRP